MKYLLCFWEQPFILPVVLKAWSVVAFDWNIVAIGDCLKINLEVLVFISSECLKNRKNIWGTGMCFLVASKQTWADRPLSLSLCPGSSMLKGLPVFVFLLFYILQVGFCFVLSFSFFFKLSISISILPLFWDTSKLQQWGCCSFNFRCLTWFFNITSMNLFVEKLIKVACLTEINVYWVQRKCRDRQRTGFVSLFQ